MSNEAFRLQRATLRTAVKDYGYARQRGVLTTDKNAMMSYRYGPGRFEGEHWSIVHWHEAVQNGDGECIGQWSVFEPDAIERAAFGIAEQNRIALHFSDQGFVSMQELTECEYVRLTDDYADDCTDEQEEFE